MADREHSKLQIVSVESTTPSKATCIVRCVGGIVRTGQIFSVRSTTDVAGADSHHIALDWIDRYGRRVDFFDPPHSATVALSGGGVAGLSKGVIISSVDA
jgi:predicted NUDIX family NTP pyrophosphohydrolase